MQMLGRSARENRARPVEAVNRRHFALEKAQVASIEITGCKGRRRPGIAVRTDNIQGSHLVAAVARSRSKKQSLGGVRRRVRNNGFCYNCRCIAALLGRAGRSLGRRRPANIRLSPGVPRRLRPNPRQTYFVILNEVKNLFPCEPKAADGLCRARRKKTNEVQSRICLRILLYRFFVDLPIFSE